MSRTGDWDHRRLTQEARDLRHKGRRELLVFEPPRLTSALVGKAIEARERLLRCEKVITYGLKVLVTIEEVVEQFGMGREMPDGHFTPIGIVASVFAHPEASKHIQILDALWRSDETGTA